MGREGIIERLSLCIDKLDKTAKTTPSITWWEKSGDGGNMSFLVLLLYWLLTLSSAMAVSRTGSVEQGLDRSFANLYEDNSQPMFYICLLGLVVKPSLVTKWCHITEWKGCFVCAGIPVKSKCSLGLVSFDWWCGSMVFLAEKGKLKFYECFQGTVISGYIMIPGYVIH